MISWVPALGALLLWWIFSAGLPTRLPVGVLDQDHSMLSRQLVRLLDAAPGLQVAQALTDPVQAQAALRSARLYAVVVVPKGFHRDVKQGRAAQVVLLHNAQLATHSGLIQRDVRTVVGTLSAGVEMTARNKRGEPAATVRAAMEPVRSDLVTLFNPSLNYEQFLAAALIPALLHILAMTAGAWAVGRELRDASLADWLPAEAGLTGTAASLLGKLVWPLLSLGAVASLALLGLTLGRGWHPPGHLGWVWLGLMALLALSIMSGALVAAATRSLRTALSITGFLTAPAFAFSGVGFPLLAMPVGARAWAESLPYTHYIRLQMEQMQMAAPLRESASTLAALLVGTVLLLALNLPLLDRLRRSPAQWGRR